MKWGILALLMLLSVSFVSSELLVSSAERPSEWTCSEYLHASKTFSAKTQEVSTGIWCREDAHLYQYICTQEGCGEKELIADGYKVDGQLLEFTDFRVGQRYFYECYACKDPSTDTPPEMNLPSTSFTFFEGDEIYLPITCSDDDGDATFLSFSGWMDEQTRQTDFGDRGRYTVTATCLDEYGSSVSEELSILLRKNNRAPEIVAVRQQ